MLKLEIIKNKKNNYVEIRNNKKQKKNKIKMIKN